MIKQTKCFGKSMFLSAALLCGVAPVALGAPMAVLAPVAEVRGSASWAGTGSARSGTLRGGEALAEGSAIRSGGGSRVVFSPVPGIAVSLANATSVTLLRQEVTKNGEAMVKRDAVLRLDAGTLSFSIDKRKTTKTRFVVLTPHGTMNAEHAVGTIAVTSSSVSISSLSGAATFTPGGSQGTISIAPGSLLTASGEGANAQIRVIDGIGRTVTDFSAAGTPLATRSATGAELESIRNSFETTLAHAATAGSLGLLGPDAPGEITVTLTQINQSFATAGLAPVDTASVGSSPPGAKSQAGSEVGPGAAPAGFSGGGSANPANTSGLIISRAQ